MTEEQFEMLEEAIGKCIVKISFHEEQKPHHKYYTRKRDFIKSIIDVNFYKKDLEYLNVYNLITEKFEQIKISNIISFMHQLDFNDDILLRQIKKSKQTLDNILKFLKENELHYFDQITNHTEWSHKNCHSIKEIYSLLKLREDLNLEFSIERIVEILDNNYDSPIQLKKFLLAYNYKNFDELFAKENKQKIKEKFISFLNERILKEQKILDLEIKNFEKQNIEINIEEVNIIKEFLGNLIDDYSIFKEDDNVQDISEERWPELLAPNPFLT